MQTKYKITHYYTLDEVVETANDNLFAMGYPKMSKSQALACGAVNNMTISGVKDVLYRRMSQVRHIASGRIKL